MIKIQVIGHLGKDCETRTVNGKNVINFNVASSEKWKDAEGNQKEKTTWINAQYWTDRTAIAPYLKKGTQVYIEGTPSIREWSTNDKSGVSLECRVGMVQLLGSAKEGQEGVSAAPAAAQAKPAGSPAMPVTDDDLPF
jgi:single-strand DNA-binding protein